MRANFPIFLSVTGISLAGAVLAFGQGLPDESFDFDAPEAWAMRYFTSATLLTSYGPAPEREAGWVDVSLETAHIPYLTKGYRTVGFGGVKEDDLNNAHVMFRPRLDYYFAPDVSVTLAYVPPIEVWDVKPHLVSGSLNWTFWREGSFAAAARVFAQWGRASGSFTCSEDFDENPFGCVGESHDRIDMNYVGAELAASWTFDNFYDLTPYVGVQVTHYDIDMHVDAVYFDGDQHDVRTMSTDGNQVTFTTGFTLPVNERISIGAQVLWAPLDVDRRPFDDDFSTENDDLFSARIQVTYALGKLIKH